MKERQLLVNMWQTPDKTILHSKHRHDFVCHEDKNGKQFCVDGGNNYVRLLGDFKDLKDLCIYSDDDFSLIREHFMRGGRGKDGTESLKWVPLKDVNDEWLDAIIDYEQDSDFLWVFLKEKEYRESLIDKCPECGHTIIEKWSGVKCSNKECSYWFCF